MIRHTPAGRGHGYRASLDQREPVVPLADQDVSLAVLATPGMSGVVAEVEVDGLLSTVNLAGLDSVGAARELSDPDGHLAAAAEAGEDTGGLDAWQGGIGA